MNILVATKHLKNYAGSEIFTRDLVFGLKNKGHQVHVFSKELGLVSDEILRSKIPVTDNLNNYLRIKFDIIHAQHSITTVLARSFFPNVPIVFLSHGTISDFEKLPKINLGISFYLGVSEEIVGNFLLDKSIDFEKVKVIRNFIDTKIFFCRKPVNEKPKKILVLSNHYVDSVKNVIETACRELGIDVAHVGMPENPQKDVSEFINKADIVVTLGRGVLEAMSCERNVIIYDWNGGDGFVNEDIFYLARKKNLSGRTKRKKYTSQEFKKEILKYNPNLGKKLREIIIKDYDLNKTISMFEEIYKNAIVKFSNKHNESIITRIILHKKIVPLFIYFTIFLNKIKKVLRIMGLTKF